MEQEEQFVTYEIALGLKEIGFYESFEHRFHPFFGCYRKEEDGSIELHTTDESEFQPDKKTDLDAPLWQQVIEWFNHQSIFIQINKKFGTDITTCSPYGYFTYDILIDNNIKITNNGGDISYKQTLKSSIENLIELYKNKK